MYRNHKILIGHKLGHADREEKLDIYLAPSKRFRVKRFVGQNKDDWEKDSYCREGFTCESFQELLKFLKSDNVKQHAMTMNVNYMYGEKYSRGEIVDRMVQRSIDKER